MEKSKTLEQRIKELEETSNKPKFSSFFDNNLSKIPDQQVPELKRKLDLLERRVKILEDQIKRRAK